MFLVIANMVGTGIFPTSGFRMTEPGDPRALLACWFAGGIFALCGALCYGKLGARFPEAGGEYVFLRESFGRPLLTLSSVNLVAVGMMIVFSQTHYHSITVGSRVQNGLTLFKIVLIVAFIAAGLCFGNGSVAHFRPSGISGRISMEAFAVSLIFISFAYSGWNAAAYLGGEIRNPGGTFPLH